MKKALSILLICFVCVELTAQTADGASTSGNDQTGGDTPEYEPYSEEEFPTWLRELRRAEVVAVGSFPITMLFTSLSYQGVRAIINAVKGTGTTASQSFGSGNFTPEESKGILITGALLSVAVAVADYIVGLVGKDDGK